ncbi:protein of unknown function (plasmid) [Candidatus Promineifilum breve]|jgi:hypothetical protein|uniref:Uncharacterized protein n=1 Tax=Candidatus Promineifilum breve TaxID=1806508 RepID=A0A160T9A7_9CHLR|nr:hypothetical protein [Candidatus Promineifilum breve]CUS06429.1 protein of unknown function [Candidatus Promineifilum breve]
MAHYANEELGVEFDIADRFTVREQLVFRGKVAESFGESVFVRYWMAGQTVIQAWSCDAVADMAALDLDATDNMNVAEIVAWTANTVAGHMNRLETPPKK